MIRAQWVCDAFAAPNYHLQAFASMSRRVKDEDVSGVDEDGYEDFGVADVKHESDDGFDGVDDAKDEHGDNGFDDVDDVKDEHFDNGFDDVDDVKDECDVSDESDHDGWVDDVKGDLVDPVSSEEEEVTLQSALTSPSSARRVPPPPPPPPRRDDAWVPTVTDDYCPPKRMPRVKPPPAQAMMPLTPKQPSMPPPAVAFGPRPPTVPPPLPRPMPSSSSAWEDTSSWYGAEAAAEPAEPDLKRVRSVKIRGGSHEQAKRCLAELPMVIDAGGLGPWLYTEKGIVYAEWAMRRGRRQSSEERHAGARRIIDAFTERDLADIYAYLDTPDGQSYVEWLAFKDKSYART